MSEDVAARKTYRYVRLGMIAAVVLLGASVLLEHHNAPEGCWQTSISAYYYTPVRAIFVGSLMAIGLSLIVIKGSTTPEDICLNVAGILAPVVALVPTSDHGTCWSIQPEPRPTIENPAGDDPLAQWVVANIDNNIQALLFAGAVGLAAAVVIAGVAIFVGDRPQQPLSNETKGAIVGLTIAALFLVGGALLFYHWDDFNDRSHGWAAMAMFGFLAGAAGANGWDSLQSKRRDREPAGEEGDVRPTFGWYPWLYFLIAFLMVASAAVILPLDWDHKILVLEGIEIVLFATLWIVQTRELWANTLRRPERPDRLSDDAATADD